MAFFTGTKTVQSFAGALYGVQVGSTLMAEVNRDIDRNGLNQTLNNYFNASFGSQSVAAVAANLVANLGITTGSADAVAYVSGKLTTAGVGSYGQAIAQILQDFAGLTGDTTYGAAATAWNQKVQAALDYTGQATVEIGTGVVYQLTTGLDAGLAFTGGNGNDTYTAPVVDNQNTFQSGDVLNGGAGVDKLEATLGVSSDFAIRAQTSGIEQVFITSQGANATGNTGDNEVAQLKNVIDAELMSGVQQWWNTNSRADLVVEDVRTLTTATTIGMRNTDAGGVDYDVYFDNQYITNAGRAQGLSTLELRMVNAFSLAEVNQPLVGFTNIQFTISGKLIDVDVTGLTTYAAVITAINAELLEQDVTEVTVEALPARTAVFTDDVGTYVQNQLAGTYTPILLSSLTSTLTRGPINVDNNTENANFLNTMTTVQGPEAPSLTQTNVVLDNVGRGSKSGELEIGGMSQSGYSGSVGIEQFNIDVQRSSWLNEVRSTNNTLEALHIENVAIGDVYTTTASARGDLRVDNLLNVRVVEAASMTGNLRLSNVQLTDAIVAKYLELGDTDANPANDNSVSTAFAHPKAGTFAKDFNYTSGAGADTINMSVSASNLAVMGTASREDFKLTINTNAGNDNVTLSIVDFVSGNPPTTPLAASSGVWYANHDINAGATNQQVVINTGEGNDTVRTPGAGDFSINLGAGDDTAYTDNMGTTGAAHYNAGRAVFVFNTSAQDNTGATGVAARDITDLSSASALTAVLAAKSSVQVTFKGLVATALVPVVNYAANDLQINQAIKAAISGNAVLNKLLVAEDGPGRTLVVRSLIDGETVETDLTVALVAPAAGSFTAAEILAINASTGNTFATSADVVTAVTAALATVQTAGVTDRYDTSFANRDGTVGTDLIGDDSTFASDNIINGGTGDDVIVLSTTGDDIADGTFSAVQATASNETVVFDGNFGNDVIVNFRADTDTDAGEFSSGYDVLNFRSYLTTGTATTLDTGVINAVVNSEIALIAQTTANDTVAEIKALYDAVDTTTAAKQLLITVNANNVGTVYTIVDGTGADDVVVTRVGSIDLADTAWTSLTIGNFA